MKALCGVYAKQAKVVTGAGKVWESMQKIGFEI
jgi:hypothetical protein